jgi:uracil-DNA glycosylase
LDNPTATATVTAATLKRDFVEALPDDLKELLQMEIETMGDDWFVALRQEFVKPYFRDVSILSFFIRLVNSR